MKQAKSISYRVAWLGSLSALAIGLNYLEGLLPPVPFLPPGAKLGFSNLAVMLGARHGGVKEALLIGLVKSLFVLLTRGFTAFLMSVAGGLLSALVTGVLLRRERQPFGYIGIGVLGAVSHNCGQLLAAMALTGPAVAVGYGPYLLAFALVTGAITGIVLKTVTPALRRLEEHI